MNNETHFTPRALAAATIKPFYMDIKESECIKIRLVAAILEKDYKYHYTHRQLASKVGTNESRLRVGFKQIYNCTIHEYITAFRIGKVKDLLMTTDWTLQTIAAHTGFKNSSLLIRNFKKNTKRTPLEWKMEKKNGIDNRPNGFDNFQVVTCL